MAIYLAAPASNFITGQIIFVGGGVTGTQSRRRPAYTTLEGPVDLTRS
jgi:hypothetical protein